jgi:hypothetical protein
VSDSYGKALKFREARSSDPGEKVLKPRIYHKQIEFLQTIGRTHKVLRL